LAGRNIATFSTGVTPAGIAITNDSHYAYICNNNNYNISGQNSVTVLDLIALVPVTTIFDASFNQPYTATLNASNTICYITNSGSTTITMINTATNTVSGTISGFTQPSGMVINSANNTAYVNNYGTGSGTTVSVVNLTSNTIVATITVGLAPAALAITSDNSYILCANYVTGTTGSGTISKIQTSTNTVVATISGLSGPFAIEVLPGNQTALVTNFGSNNFSPFGTTVSVLNLSSNTVQTTIANVGIQPSGLAIKSAGNLAIVSCYNTLYAGASFTDLTYGQGTAVVINLITNTILSTTPVGRAPSFISILPNQTAFLVSCYGDNCVHMISL